MDKASAVNCTIDLAIAIVCVGSDTGILFAKSIISWVLAFT